MKIRNILIELYKYIVLTRGFEAEINDSVLKRINDVVGFFDNPKGKFGLLLCGGKGNGKSTLAETIKQFIIVSSRKSLINPKASRVAFIDAKSMVLGLLESDDRRNEIDELCRDKYLIMDDIGAEPSELMVFGNNLDPIGTIIKKRYSNHLFTIITTNLTPTQLKMKYGELISDRLKEMMLIIPFTDDSFRGRSKYVDIHELEDMDK